MAQLKRDFLLHGERTPSHLRRPGSAGEGALLDRGVQAAVLRLQLLRPASGTARRMVRPAHPL